MTITQDTVSEPEDPGPSPRFSFIDLLRKCAAAYPERSAGEVAAIVAKQVIDENRALAEAYFAQEGKLILTWELRADMIQTRRGIYRVVDITKNGEGEVERMPEKKRESVYEKVKRWTEYDPLSKQTQRTLSFTKPMLIASADYDAATVLHHAEKSVWKRNLADGLPNDTITVEEFYEPDQLLKAVASARSALVQDIASGNVRIQLSPGVSLAPKLSQ